MEKLKKSRKNSIFMLKTKKSQHFEDPRMPKKCLKKPDLFWTKSLIYRVVKSIASQ